jgi:HPt (histidine-containing phosphotransfer) domain-containing protein
VTLAREVIAAFLEDHPGRLRALEDALRANDLTQVRRGAHAIKGAAATVGGPALATLAKVIEELAAEGQVTLFELASRRVAESSAALEAALRSTLSRLQVTEAPVECAR